MKTKMGVVKRIPNKNPKPFAAKEYYAVWVEDEDGGNNRCIMLTNRELYILPVFHCKECERTSGLIGRLYAIYKSHSYALALDVGGIRMLVQVSPGQLKIFERRASINLEDVPTRKLVDRLFR